MKPLNAVKIKINIGNLWISPILHVLITREDDIVVARCLDFTVSSHGIDELDALNSLAEMIKEYVLTAIEDSNIDNLYDSANNKYWKLFHDIEGKLTLDHLKESLSKTILSKPSSELEKLDVNLTYV